MKKKKVRYGVAGLGWIAQTAVLPAFSHAGENSELTALISSDEQKLHELGRRYKIKNLYRADEMDACLSSGEIDALYIALPNHLHHPYTLAAARNGIHVLVEKPMAMSIIECEEMIEACQAANVKLMVAYRLHFDQANLDSIAIAQSGKLGELRLFNSSFTYSLEDDANYRLKADAGGGPLYDLGIYCINAARYLFQDEPVEITGLAGTGDDSRFTQVEESFSALMKFPGGRLAQFTCSFGSTDSAAFEVIGSEGKLRLDPAYEIKEPRKLRVTTAHKDKETTYRKTDQFAPELVHFSDCILKGKTPEPSGLEGLIDVYIINGLYLSAQERRAVQIEPLHKMQRPSKELKMVFPPPPRQKLVNVEAPAA